VCLLSTCLLEASTFSRFPLLLDDPLLSLPWPFRMFLVYSAIPTQPCHSRFP
jgi:hypothetical protein